MRRREVCLTYVRSRGDPALRHSWFRMAVLWGVLLAFAPGGAVWALDLVTQITPGATYQTRFAKVSADGSAVAFETRADILGTNPDNSSEIYHLDLTDWTITQLTAGKPAETVPVGISSDGSKVLFYCDGDLLGTNPDLSREVFVVKANGTGLTQLTSDPVYDSSASGISGDGKLAVFYSQADHTGKNSDHSYEIFAIDTSGMGLIQLTEATGKDSRYPRVSADGSLIAFHSAADLTGSNADGGNEVFIVDPDGTGLTQLTDGASAGDDCQVGSLSSDGSVIAFSSCTDLTAENPGNSWQQFVVNSDGTGMAQLTLNTGGGYIWGAELTADGSSLVFTGCVDLTGENPDMAGRVFRINADGMGLEHLLDAPVTTDCGWADSISADGSIIGLSSTCNLTGTNLGHLAQAFLFEYGLGIVQLMPAPSSVVIDESMSADGSLITFSSTANPVGANPDHTSEIFIINADGTGLAQLTPWLATLHSRVPRLSADGTTVVFHSNSNLTGGNPDHSDEIFLVKADGTGLTQLTDDPVIDSTNPSISADGSLVAFATVTGTSPSYTGEVYVVNADGTGLTQLTNAPGDLSGWARISPDGSLVAFYSRADLTGDNPDGSSEVFVVHPDGTGLLQITDSLHDSSPGSFTADGSLLALASAGDLTGGNPAHNNEIFVVNSDGTGLTQVTSVAEEIYLWGPEISLDGSRIVSWGCLGPAEANPDGSPEVWAVNTDGTGFRQLTATPSICSGSPAVTADGSIAAFFSASDPVTGRNPDDAPQIFLMELDSFFMGQTEEGAGSSTACGDVTVTFDNVTEEGITSVTLCDEPPADSPTGFSFLGQYYDITTDAIYYGTITVEIQYDDTGLTPAEEAALRLLHWEGGAWVDVTVLPVDTVNNIIRGEVTVLSPFAPAVLEAPIFGGFRQPINADGSSVFKAGRTIPVKFSLSDASGSPMTDAVCHLSLWQVSSSIMGSVEETAEAVYEDVGDTFRYDEEEDQYIYNLSTKGLATGTWLLRVTVDGWPAFEETVQIGLR